jgi:hypothetical protein
VDVKRKLEPSENMMFKFIRGDYTALRFHNDYKVKRMVAGVTKPKTTTVHIIEGL